MATVMEQRLRDLRTGLTRLHKTLLDDQREAYEVDYGPVESSHALLQLVLHHETFAWLRSLSALIAAIDAALDEADGQLPDPDVEAFFAQAHALLRSGGSSRFETNYRDALQRSADVVIAHATVVKRLSALAPPRSGP
jgi:hypothetical protein